MTYDAKTIKRTYAGINGYDPYGIHVKKPSYAWVKYVGIALLVITIRFLCCS